MEWVKVPNVSPNPYLLPEQPIVGLFPSLQQGGVRQCRLSTGMATIIFRRVHWLWTPLSNVGRISFRVFQASDNAANYLNVIRGITQDFHSSKYPKESLASFTQGQSRYRIRGTRLANKSSTCNCRHKAGDRVFELSFGSRNRMVLRAFTAHLLHYIKHHPS